MGYLPRARLVALLLALIVTTHDVNTSAVGRPQAPPAASAASINELLRDGFALYESDRLDAARDRFDAALGAATRAEDLHAEAEAHRGLGLVLGQQASYLKARAELERALELFERTGDPVGAARVERWLAYQAQLAGDWKRAAELSRRALADFEALGDQIGQAGVLFDSGLSTQLSARESIELLHRAEAMARTAGDRQLLGQVLQALGDLDFSQGDFSAAVAHLESAITLFDQIDDARDQARALVSLGRLQRTHGHADLALEMYRRALNLQVQRGDQQGVIQSTNAIGVALNALGRHREALEYYQRALALARQTGSSRIIAFQLGNLGGAYLKSGDFEKAVEILREVLLEPLDPYGTAIRENQLAEAYLHLRRYPESIEAVSRAIGFFEADHRLDDMLDGLSARASAFRASGRAADALADDRSALRILEQLRARLVATDFMKQGFGRRHQEVFADTIDLLHTVGNDTESLEVAERARGRALLDLLATRGLSDRSVAGPPAASTTGAVELTLRGGTAIGVASTAAADAIPFGDIVTTARRLKSTLLVYYVSPEATFVWVVGPSSGTVRAVKINISASRLADLVRQARPQVAPGTRGSTTAPSIETRGGEAFVPVVTRRSALRELYRVLVGPVRAQLPRASGGRVTIVPHGPLFLLSFAALQDDTGAYLLERYTLNYAPAAAVLPFTDRQQQRIANRPAQYLLVADPVALPAALDGTPLPPLPGARREVAMIARALPPDAVTILSGADALEPAVRSHLRGATVIHLATHGIVRDDDPLESFLALGRGDPRGPEGTNADGRLTAAKIYQLDLDADLVVLSACRTGLGSVSPDGIAGLTRAFLSAGAASIMATLWDVADEPTVRLFPTFYRRRAEGLGKAEALRAAQLRLLGDLRAGRVKLGSLALPEDPFFWAGFILVGEP